MRRVTSAVGPPAVTMKVRKKLGMALEIFGTVHEISAIPEAPSSLPTIISDKSDNGDGDTDPYLRSGSQATCASCEGETLIPADCGVLATSTSSPATAVGEAASPPSASTSMEAS